MASLQELLSKGLCDGYLFDSSHSSLKEMGILEGGQNNHPRRRRYKEETHLFAPDDSLIGKLLR